VGPRVSTDGFEEREIFWPPRNRKPISCSSIAYSLVTIRLTSARSYKEGLNEYQFRIYSHWDFFTPLVDEFGRIICFGYMTRIGDIRNAYRILIWKLETRERLGNLGKMQAQETAHNTIKFWDCEVFRLALKVCKVELLWIRHLQSVPYNRRY
jgi:hypothetical protein